jgi:hydrogenase maturation protein HypF
MSRPHGAEWLFMPTHERREITVSGIVQGVGFRPFVQRLAAAHGLGGSVRNQSGTVLIDVEGPVAALDRFVQQLASDAPPHARIIGIRCAVRAATGARVFTIAQSAASAAVEILLPGDLATCAACLRELFDPADRRYGYPFITCTECGPRLTIIDAAPYDRERTSMRRFTMCAACRQEYEDPHDRRFHAETIACVDCGPRLTLVRPDGEVVGAADPIREFAALLRSGGIGAVQGLGGFHLACDARNADAVAELRRRKGRDDKPFAIMVAGVEEALRICDVPEQERALLTAPQAPIVLLRRIPASAALVCDGVAPGNPTLGVLLPYTPVHHLLVRAVGSAPLVMTSGNRAEEPIATEPAEALQRLHGIADLFLTHDRAIRVRCDDSVTRVLDGAELPIRRSRGYAPTPLSLPAPAARPTLALGGQFKAVFGLAKGSRAILSHHVGDLDHVSASEALEREIRLYERLFEISPTVLVHDRHPDYATTLYAERRANSEGLQRLAVQHHHAHLCSCMAEHGLQGRVIGVIFDGMGLGPDSPARKASIWGGEFLIGDYTGYVRAGHLREVRQPGGDRAAREPWRMAVAHLLDAECELGPLEARITPGRLRLIAELVGRGRYAPWTSSAGRLFDAVAALIGLRDEVNYEGQAAMELEWLAEGTTDNGAYPLEIRAEPPSATMASPVVVDTRPTIAAVVADVAGGTDRRIIARRFHAALAEAIVQVCSAFRSAAGLDRVVLSGGVFLNALLTRMAERALHSAGFIVYRHRLVPPSDGGLALGQLAVAAAALEADGG